MNPHTTSTASVPKSFRASLVFGLLILLVGLVGEHGTEAVRCDRTPEGTGASKSPADGRFRLRISGNPEKYVPGESYTSEYRGMVFAWVVFRKALVYRMSNGLGYFPN